MKRENREMVSLNCQERESRENISDGSFEQKELSLFAPNFVESKKAVFIDGLPANLDELKEINEKIVSFLKESSNTLEKNSLEERTEKIEKEISLLALGANVELKPLIGDFWHQVAVVDCIDNTLVTVERMMVLNGFGNQVGQTQYVSFDLIKDVSVIFGVGLRVPMKVVLSENKLTNVEMYIAQYKGIEGYLFTDANAVLYGVMQKKNGVCRNNLESVFVPCDNLKSFLEENFNLQVELQMVESKKKELFVDSFMEVVNLVF